MTKAPFWLTVDAARTFAALDLDAESVDALARRRLGRLLSSLAWNNAFYGRRFQEVGIEWADPILQLDPYRALAALPPVSKQELRQAGPQVLAGGRVDPRWHSSASSGSTGEPFRVYYEPRAWATLKYAVKLRARRACGVGPTDRVAILDAIPRGTAASRLEQAIGCERISVLQSASSVAAALLAFQPDVIYGLPSALDEAARALEARGDRLQPTAVFTSGELLDGSVRERLAGAFRAPIYDIYGTSETKEIAWECPRGGMHLNNDVVRLEVLDDAGRSLPAGQEGNLVATLLVNRAMPLLRYLTGDRGALLSGTCACGRSSPLLGVLTGRTADMLVLRGGQRISPYALTCALERVGGVLRYQVSQLDPARVRVRAILEGAANREAIAHQMRTALRFDVAPFLDADVEFVDRLPTGPRAKFRVVEPLR
ncbi:MAG TPA: AMP-binding protein [Gemmatimonadales bacterium]|nr:AMP-binding protein [Gemmatimonadales bacterium]